ncbi:leucine-rich repeat domain-containing protein [Myroides fluvii]|uniref:hypothetical protein n=1 Tax=Myroides fluvii TaxID=2572594 RepID=UPI00131BC368|nr:hypothetical protein [Myroides fluvii]
MHITALPWGKRIDLDEESDLKEARRVFDSGKYGLRIGPFTEINDSFFLDRFLIHFKDISDFNFMAWGDGVSYDFLYQMTNLERLHLDVMYPIDFSKLSKLTELSLMWNKKFISNFQTLRNLEQLTISDFKEKDLSSLASLKSLTTLSFKTASIKSLNGIEELIHLKRLSLGGVRSLVDLTAIASLQKLKFLEIDIAWKLQDCSPIGQLGELEVLQLMDCKNLASIQFVRQMPKLRQLYTLGTTMINDYDTTPAEHIPIFFGSLDKKYTKMYPEKEIREGQRTWSSYH